MVATAPLEVRRLYFVGIGGSGMSAYANIARAWGAEVRGWDVGETIFTKTLDGVDLDLGGEPCPPDGYEVVVSTGHRDRIDLPARRLRARRLSALREFTAEHGESSLRALGGRREAVGDRAC